jgi:RHS repeat-associated protein
VIYTQEATYQYYAHGPLARTKLGEEGKVETQDYAYTIQGWIKQVQGNAFGYALGYNDKDYSPIGTSTSNLATPIEAGKNLYNGNIATMTSKTPAISTTPWVQQYTYDQLNRIKTSATPGSSQYATSYNYDANGNILNLTRKDDTGNDLDNLVYTYETKANGYQRNTNKLRSVDDAVMNSANTSDIEDQSNDNYTYDAIGNLISDRSEEIENIEWSVSGKVLSVTRTQASTKPNLEFSYDASGQRVCKKVIKPNGTITSTYYVRDASGNVMSVYTATSTETASVKEQYIYGSSRIGVYYAENNTTSNARTLGLRHYELTDHLGNVRVVLSDYKQEIISASDYYPFGMVARSYVGNKGYRYGYNGQEQEEELSDSHTSAEYWMYDGRLGRRWNIDPVVKEHESPYACFANNPIWLVDFDGRDTSITGTIKAQSEIMDKPYNPAFVPAGVKLESTANVSADIHNGKIYKVKAIVIPKEFESPVMGWAFPGEGIDPAFTEVRKLSSSISKDGKTAKIHYEVVTQLTLFEVLGQWAATTLLADDTWQTNVITVTQSVDIEIKIGSISTTLDGSTFPEHRYETLYNINTGNSTYKIKHNHTLEQSSYKEAVDADMFKERGHSQRRKKVITY